MSFGCGVVNNFSGEWPREVLWISSDTDDERIFEGLEILDSGIVGGRKMWQEFFWVA